MAEVNEKMVERIKKLFALSNDNPSIKEAESAALKAQQLMAQFGIEAEDLEEIKKIDLKIEINKEYVGPGRAWKFDLASVIADNFRCKQFSYGKSTIAFYGNNQDSKIANEVFKNLFILGDKLAEKEKRKARLERGNAVGIYNSFIQGFIHGIKEKLDAQCVALKVVIAEEVKEQYLEFIKGAKVSRAGMNTSNFDHTAYESGVSEGRGAMESRRLKG